VISVQIIVLSLESLQIRRNHNWLKSLSFFFSPALSGGILSDRAFRVHIGSPQNQAAYRSEPMSNTIQDTARKHPIVPHHEVSETFADQVGAIMFDGSTLKVDFVVVRLVAALPPATTGERHVVARLVLPPAGAIDLINQVKQLADQMARAGLIKTEQQGQVVSEAKSN
jgi:hypothetical protein